MAKREYILRHQKIIQKLRAGKPVPFEGLQDYLRDQTELHSLDLCISKRTFQRDINEIRSIYGIDIHYDIPGGGYYIDAADTSDIQERILESFDMITSLKMVHDVTRFIQFEKRRPQGTRHFFGLLHAIKNRFVIHLTHQAFYRDEPVVHIIEPWFLKEFRERWYIIGREVKKDAVKTFGLDRIQDFTITKKRFTYPEGYNPDALFKDCFGIFNPMGSKPADIVLLFDPEQGKYIKTFPLHESQHILTDNNKEFRIRLHLHITYDLIMELLSYGEKVEVIKPKSLRKDLVKIYQNAIKNNSAP